jgi:hypothetical protein
MKTRLDFTVIAEVNDGSLNFEVVAKCKSKASAQLIAEHYAALPGWKSAQVWERFKSSHFRACVFCTIKPLPKSHEPL